MLQGAVGVLGLRLVVGEAVKVLGEGCGTIALVVGHGCAVGLVDRELEVVGPQAVAVCVRVGEKAALEHLVVGDIDTWDEVSGGEGDLFDFCKVVFGVAVESHFADFLEWVVFMRPHLRYV